MIPNDNSDFLDFAVQPLLTDLYQLTMCYAYWKAQVHEQHSVFDLFFRKVQMSNNYSQLFLPFFFQNPFHGEYTVFAGLGDCISFVKRFRYTTSGMF